MFNSIKKILAPPIFPDDEEKTRAARYGNWIALAFIVLIISYEIFSKLTAKSLILNILDYSLTVVLAFLLAALALMRRGRVNQANILLVSFLWVLVNVFSYLGFGIRDSAYISNFIIILSAGLLLGWRAASVLTFATIVAGFGLAYAETNNLSPTAYYSLSPSLIMRDTGAILVIYAVLIFLLISGWDNAIKGLQKGKDQLEAINRNLQESQINLEKNQKELLSTNRQLIERTDRINTIAEISKVIAAIRDINTLLSSVVNIVAQRFQYYHVGIFLLDERKEFALLRAANSQGGQNMLARGHRLKVGEQSIVGYVTYSGNPRIVLDVGKDAVFFNNPDLADTHSEVALPLKFGDEIVGALDIQSTETNAFSHENMEIFSILADQVTVAIQNVRSLEQAQRALHEAEIATSQLTGMAWKGYSERAHSKGYRYNGIRPESLKETTKPAEEKDSLTVPIQLRGQTIGRLKLKSSDTSRKLTEDELAIIGSTADRVALAIDGARLLDEAQKRAARETFLSEMGAKLSTSFQLDSILRDTVEELGQQLKGSTVSFQLVNPSAPPTSEKQDESSTSRKKAE